jgi:hypothetical protein
VPISKGSACKQWWEYAGNCVRAQLNQKTVVWTWDYLAKRRDQRKAYIAFYTDYLMVKSPSSAMTADLKHIERHLSYDDIILYRQIAKARAPQHPQSAVNKVLSYFRFTPASSPAPKETELVLTAEQKQMIASIIGYEGPAPKHQASENFIATVMDFGIKVIKFELLHGRRFSATKQTVPRGSIADIALSQLACTVSLRPAVDAMAVNLEINRFASSCLFILLR